MSPINDFSLHISLDKSIRMFTEKWNIQPMSFLSKSDFTSGKINRRFKFSTFWMMNDVSPAGCFCQKHY